MGEQCSPLMTCRVRSRAGVLVTEVSCRPVCGRWAVDVCRRIGGRTYHLTTQYLRCQPSWRDVRRIVARWAA